VYAEFEHYLGLFRSFVAEAGLGSLLPNQWELTYVDSVPQGELWQTAADWHKVLPGLLAPLAAVEGLHPENVGGAWAFEIAPRRGRLHVTVNRARSGKEGEVVLLVQTTARGPIGKGGEQELKAGLDLGHDAAVRAFLAFTSEQAKKHWGRKA
jgi:hypothetical protein